MSLRMVAVTRKYQESMQVVDDFIVHYPDYQRPPIVPAQSPARMIATALMKN